MDEMYRRGYGRGPMYYPPQQVDPSIVSFGQLQMYDPEHYDRVAASIADSQQRYDASQAAVAKHIDDIGSADIDPRYRDEVLARMYAGMEDLYDSILRDYEGDIGKASSRVIQNLSQDRGLMHQAVMNTAQERQARAEYQQLAASGNAPREYNPSTRRPETVSFEKYHGEQNLGGFDESGMFRRGTFKPLRGAGEHDKWALNNITKGIMSWADETDPSRLSGDMYHLYQTVKQQGMTIENAMEYMDENRDQMLDSFLRNSNFAIEEFTNEDGVLMEEDAWNFLKNTVAGQVNEARSKGHGSMPAPSENTENNSMGKKYAGYYLPAEEDKDAKRIREETEISLKNIKELQHMRGVENSLEMYRGTTLVIPEQTIKSSDMFISERLKKEYPGMFTEDFNIQETRERYNTGDATSQDAYNLRYFKGLSGAWGAFKETESEEHAKARREQDLDTYKTETTQRYQTIVSGAPLQTIKTGTGTVVVTQGIVKPDSDHTVSRTYTRLNSKDLKNVVIPEKGTEEYELRGDALKILWDNSKDEPRFNYKEMYNLVLDERGIVTFKEPSVKGASEKKKIEYVRNAIKAANKLSELDAATLAKKSAYETMIMDNFLASAEKYPVLEAMYNNLVVQGKKDPVDTVVECMELFYNTKRGEELKMHIAVPFKSIDESVTTRAQDDKETYLWLRDGLLRHVNDVDAKAVLGRDFIAVLNGKNPIVEHAEVSFGDFTMTVKVSNDNNMSETQTVNIESLVPSDQIIQVRAIKDFVDRHTKLDFVTNTKGTPTITHLKVVVNGYTFYSELGMKDKIQPDGRVIKVMEPKISMQDPRTGKRSSTYILNGIEMSAEEAFRNETVEYLRNTINAAK